MTASIRAISVSMLFELCGRYPLASEHCRSGLDGAAGAKDILQVDLGDPRRKVIRWNAELGKTLNIGAAAVADRNHAQFGEDAQRLADRPAADVKLVAQRSVPRAVANRRRTRRQKPSRGFHEPVCWPKSPCPWSLHPHKWYSQCTTRLGQVKTEGKKGQIAQGPAQGVAATACRAPTLVFCGCAQPANGDRLEKIPSTKIVCLACGVFHDLSSPLHVICRSASTPTR